MTTAPLKKNKPEQNKSSTIDSDAQAQQAKAAAQRIRLMVESGEDADRVFEAIAATVIEFPGISSCSIYLPAETTHSTHQSFLAGHAGELIIPEPNQTAIEKKARISVHGNSRSYKQDSESPFFYTDIICLGAPIGALGVAHNHSLTTGVIDSLAEISCYISVVFERQRITSKLQNFIDRLEVLNELNQLIASGVGIDRIARNLAREAAFRFSADCSITMLLSSSGEHLDFRGSYGCAPDSIPKSIEIHNTLMGRALRLGGLMSVVDLGSHPKNGLEFLSDLWVNCIHCCSVEVKGETLGAILLGFRQSTFLDERESSMFEEFARGAAVAIANARSQERLSTYAEHLEELVQQRTADLAIQTTRAEEASSAKSRFVANISHELRTPLTAIVGYSSVLADGVFGEISDKQKDALLAITRSGEHLKQLIDDVLNISRIESGKQNANPEKVNLATVLEQSYRLMLQTAIGKGVKLHAIDNSEELQGINLWMDPRHIRQVLINLLSNAVKYTPSGGDVWLEAQIVGDKARISIRDTGVGIPESQLKTLFERFERGDDSYSREQVGTGIGLSLTQHLIEINGGKVEAESQYQIGSTFWVLAPLADVSSLAEDSSSLDDSLGDLKTKLNGLNVLVVDDNVMACDVLKTIIDRAGGSAHIAHSVTEAKTIAGRINFDAALIDLVMPKESGIELIHYFRKECEEPFRSMPLIVVSACVFDTDRETAMRSGASLFIAKPFKPIEIVGAIRRLTTATAISPSGTFKVVK